MKGNSKQAYYDRHKDEEWFKERNRMRARKYREEHPEYKAYQQEYRKAYYEVHKEILNKNRKNYPDRTRNERVNRFKQKQRDNLGDAYIIAILIRRKNMKKEDVTLAMIEERRKQILQKRIAKK